MMPVFDIEAVSWVFPTAVGLYVDEEYTEFLKKSEDYDVVWEFLQYLGEHYPGYKLYAHNASNYDNKFILQTLIKHNQKVSFPAGLAKLVWTEKDISFEDSFLLVGRSLESTCIAFDVPRKLEWDHKETENPWDMEPSQLDKFRAYLKRDCVSLSLALDAFARELLDRFGVTPSATLSLTSVKAFDKSFYPVNKIATNEDFEKFIRAATYGGRNEVYKRYGENVLMYDMKGMFVSCYDVPMPVGKMQWTRPNMDQGVVAEALVKVPTDLPIGPLPVRFHGRLIFPVGELPKGWWDMVELRHAAEKYGVDIKLTRQLDCDQSPILKEFGEVMGDLRKVSNIEMSRIWKIFGLRLSGKFGQHRTRTEIKHITDIEDLTGYVPIDPTEIYHEKTVVSTGHRSPYIKPAINMRVRAEARNRHLDYLMSVKSRYYCDTDSIHTNETMPMGNELGELNLVGEARRAYYIACKFYGYINQEGALKQRTSGFRDFELSEEQFKKLLEGDGIEHIFGRMGSWREILKGKGFNLNDIPRRLRAPDFPNRITEGLETRPIELPLKKELRVEPSLDKQYWDLKEVN